jgi:hypothetical protein
MVIRKRYEEGKQYHTSTGTVKQIAWVEVGEKHRGRQVYNNKRTHENGRVVLIGEHTDRARVCPNGMSPIPP